MDLVYIASPGHSGSTLLDMLLGVHEDVFSTGELVHLSNQYHRNIVDTHAPLKGTSCSCKKGFFDCDFWGKFITELNDRVTYNATKEPLKYKLTFMMNHSIPHLRYTHKLKRKLFLLAIKYNIPFVDGITKRISRKQIKNNELLVDIVGQLSGDQYMVDSTKDIYRLHYLLSSNIRIKVIVLKRNILGVTASGLKRNSNLLKIAKGWVKYYKKLDTIVRRNNIQPLIVSYENLVDDTLNEINRIYRYLGLKEIESFTGTFQTRDYHVVAGNGMRYRGEISIRKDEKWKQALSAEQINTISKLRDQLKDTLFE